MNVIDNKIQPFICQVKKSGLQEQNKLKYYRSGQKLPRIAKTKRAE